MFRYWLMLLLNSRRYVYSLPYPLELTAALCVIFTILVSLSRDNALFALKAKINVVWNFFERSGPKGASGVRKFFQTTLILVFEVIVQPHENIFWHFQVRPKSWKSYISSADTYFFPWNLEKIFMPLLFTSLKAVFQLARAIMGHFLERSALSRLWYITLLIWVNRNNSFKENVPWFVEIYH